jgi:hypothetical protein
VPRLAALQTGSEHNFWGPYRLNFFGCWRVSLHVGNGAAARTTLASGPAYTNLEAGPHGQVKDRPRKELFVGKAHRSLDGLLP